MLDSKLDKQYEYKVVLEGTKIPPKEEREHIYRSIKNETTQPDEEILQMVELDLNTRSDFTRSDIEEQICFLKERKGYSEMTCREYINFLDDAIDNYNKELERCTDESVKAALKSCRSTIELSVETLEMVVKKFADSVILIEDMDDPYQTGMLFKM